jgi:hypothetical protein
VRYRDPSGQGPPPADTITWPVTHPASGPTSQVTRRAASGHAQHPARPGGRRRPVSLDLVLQEVLTDAPDPQEAVDELVRRVHAAGAPDNVAVAVADVRAA